MLDFRPVTLDDRDLLDSYFRPIKSRQLNYTLEVLYLWRDACEFVICEYEGLLLIKTFYYCNHNFLFPVGEGDLYGAMQKMEEYSLRHKCPFSMLKINEPQKEVLEQAFPGRYSYMEDRDEEEYIYLTDRLMNLTGKALQPKRNHINALIKNHAFSFEPITRSNFDEVVAFNRQWEEAIPVEQRPSSMKIEVEAVHQSLTSFFDITTLDGGLLRVDGRVEGFSIGCGTFSDTYLTLFERANMEVRGSYPLLNREFTRAFASDYTYVNRAEDCGDEGLRRAKLSYQPDRLDKRYVVKL